jgi:hypothetical protein
MSELYTYSHEHVSGDLDAFLSVIMDENGLPGDLLEDEHYMCYSEGTICQPFQSASLIRHKNMNILCARYA